MTHDYTLEEARAHMTLVALTGGSLFLGDRLDTLPEERVALLTDSKLMSIWREGNHAVLLDLFQGAGILRLWKLVRPGGEVILGIFNWSDPPSRVGLSVSEFGLNENQSYY